jgi:hypothetical protein
MDAGLGTVSVVSLDPASSAPGNEVTVVGDAEDVYVSTTDVYVATTAWPSQATGGSTASSGAVAGSGGGSSAGSTAVAPGGSTGTASVSTEPGTGPTGTVCPMDAACAPLPRSTVPVLPTPTVPVTPTVTVPVPPTVTVPVTVPVQPEDLSTDIYAFDISNPDAPAYLGSGSVPGTLISQYSMSEYEGYLRVATTEGEPAPAPVDNEPVPSQLSDNIVSVLEPVNGSLVTVGSLTGLGAGEEIYAVRFIGDLGYVVTFNQTDPLYVVDLSNPAQPVLAGQLSLSGYSSFLQPLGDGQLLGIGQSVDQELRTQGLQLEVFNVADPAQPTLVSHHELGAGVFSAAQYDPHALLWWAPDGLLVLPVDNYDVVPAAAGSQPQQPATASSEAEVWSVSSSGQLAEVGSVVQPAQSTSTASGPFEGSSPEIERAVVVGGDLYTVSEQGVMASDLSSLAQVAWLPYPASQS